MATGRENKCNAERVRGCAEDGEEEEEDRSGEENRLGRRTSGRVKAVKVGGGRGGMKGWYSLVEWMCALRMRGHKNHRFIFAEMCILQRQRIGAWVRWGREWGGTQRIGVMFSRREH